MKLFFLGSEGREREAVLRRREGRGGEGEGKVTSVEVWLW